MISLLKLSVIIPVYNVERWIKECIDALLEIHIEGLSHEIILVNDGSNDSSGSICEDYAERFPAEVKFISQQNSGASAARNAGMGVATGDYIWFVDADDCIVKESVAEILRIACDFSPDIIAFNYRKLLGECECKDFILYQSNNQQSGVEYLRPINPSMYLWNKWFKREAIGKTRFLHGTKNIEDFLFCAEVVSGVSSVYTLNVVGYQYNCLNQMSTSRNHTVANLKKLTDDTIAVHSRLYSIINTCDRDVSMVLRNLLNCSIAGHLYSIFLYYSVKRAKDVIAFYRSNELYPIPKTNNKRANRFLILANHKWAYLAAVWLKGLLRR